MTRLGLERVCNKPNLLDLPPCSSQRLFDLDGSWQDIAPTMYHLLSIAISHNHVVRKQSVFHQISSKVASAVLSSQFLIPSCCNHHGTRRLEHAELLSQEEQRHNVPLVVARSPSVCFFALHIKHKGVRFPPLANWNDIEVC